MNRLGIVLVVMGAVGCKKRLKTEDIESFLTKRLTEIGVTPTKVTCPKELAPKVGATFDCSTTIEGTAYEITVTITKVADDKFEFDNVWKRGNAVFRNKVIPMFEPELAKAYAMPIKVACPEPLLFVDAAHHTACEMSGGNAKTKLVITVDDKLDVTDWAVDPPLVIKKQLEDKLTERVRAKTTPTVTISCGPNDLIPRPADGHLDCTATDAGKSAPLRVEINEKLDEMSWELR